MSGFDSASAGSKRDDAQADALRRSEQRLRLAQEAAMVGVWELDLETRVTYQSPECEALLGIEPGMTLTQEAWRSRVHPDDLPGVDALWTAVVEERRSFEVEFRILLPSGQVRWLLSKGRSLVDGSGRAIRLLGVNVDITARKQAELAMRTLNAELEERVRQRTAELERSNRLLTAAKEAAEEANLAKTAFLRTMSHELRTPLNAIIGFSDVLLAGLMGDLQDEQVKAVRVIQRSSAELLELIQDILDLSRIEAGVISVAVAEVDLRSVLAEQCDAMQPTAGARNLGLTLAAVEQPLLAIADRKRVSQVIRNLVDNAIKFTDEGGVRVRAFRDQELVRVEVEDTGIGIEPVHHELIFRPFQRVEIRSGAARPGTGLGLAICQRLITAMGGHIGVRSTPGRGSCFWFTLPAAPPGD